MLATDDETALQYPLPSSIYGFHAQQSCEKWMKALISALDTDYPFTHRLDMLAGILEKLHEQLPDVPFALENLEPFAVVHRYEGGQELTESQRAQMRESVTILREHILTRILDLERGVSG